MQSRYCFLLLLAPARPTGSCSRFPSSGQTLKALQWKARLMGDGSCRDGWQFPTYRA